MAVRLFVGNMPYGATDADLRAHFAGVGEPSQVVIPVDRETGRPRGFAFVEFLDRAVAEAAIARFNQQPFMGRIAVGQRSATARGARTRAASGRPAAVVASAARRPAAASAGPRPPGGGFGGPRPAAAASAAPRPAGGPGGFRPAGGGRPTSTIRSARRRRALAAKSAWENKERGPKGPIKERYTGRLGGLYDDPNDDDRAAHGLRRSRVESPGRGRRQVAEATMATHVKVIGVCFIVFGACGCWGRCSRASSCRCWLGSSVGPKTPTPPMGATVLGITGVAAHDVPAGHRPASLHLRLRPARLKTLGAHPGHRPRRDLRSSTCRSARSSASTRSSFCSTRKPRHCSLDGGATLQSRPCRAGPKTGPSNQFDTSSFATRPPSRRPSPRVVPARTRTCGSPGLRSASRSCRHRRDRSAPDGPDGQERRLGAGHVRDDRSKPAEPLDQRPRARRRRDVIAALSTASRSFE